MQKVWWHRCGIVFHASLLNPLRRLLLLSSVLVSSKIQLMYSSEFTPVWDCAFLFEIAPVLKISALSEPSWIINAFDSSKYLTVEILSSWRLAFPSETWEMSPAASTATLNYLSLKSRRRWRHLGTVLDLLCWCNSRSISLNLYCRPYFRSVLATFWYHLWLKCQSSSIVYVRGNTDLIADIMDELTS